MPDFDLTAQGFRLPHFHKLSKKQALLLYLIDASETHPVFFVRNRRRTKKQLDACKAIELLRCRKSTSNNCDTKTKKEPQELHKLLRFSRFKMVHPEGFEPPTF